MFAPYVINARNVDVAFGAGLSLLQRNGAVRAESRNGAVTMWPGPVTTFTERPMERVLFNPVRKANPFFHLFESLWMLAGRNDLPWLAKYNARMATYSDDGGKTQPAAYGHRWRHYFGYDQLSDIISELRRDPTTRRCVLTMWDGWGIHQEDKGDGPVNHFGDLHGAMQGSKDVPCNTQCYFTIHDEALHMAVTCRSNDAVWGAHGANAVHFSVLLEYVAAYVGVRVGTMTQFSWNYHMYDGVINSIKAVAMATNPYESGNVAVTPMFMPETMECFDRELPTILDWMDSELVTQPGVLHPFLHGVVVPMARAWAHHKGRNYQMAIGCMMDAMPGDWQLASLQFLKRARANYEKGNLDG